MSCGFKASGVELVAAKVDVTDCSSTKLPTLRRSMMVRMVKDNRNKSNEMGNLAGLGPAMARRLSYIVHDSRRLISLRVDWNRKLASSPCIVRITDWG